MHADVAGSGFSDDLPHLCIGAVRGDVVDNEAPAANASRATLGFWVSMERTNSGRLAKRSITGMTRSSSSCSDTFADPGRVDSPPMSRISAP